MASGLLRSAWAWLWRIGLPLVASAAAGLAALAVASHDGPYIVRRDFSTRNADHVLGVALDAGRLWVVDHRRTPGSPPPPGLRDQGPYVPRWSRTAPIYNVIDKGQVYIRNGGFARDRQRGEWWGFEMCALRLAPLAVGVSVLFAALCWLPPGRRVLGEWAHGASRLWRPRRGGRLRRRGFQVVRP